MSGVLTPSLPSRDAVGRLLRDLFGKSVTQKKAPAPFAMSPKVFVATYLDELHVRFKDLVQPGDKVPPNVAPGTAKPASRLDLEIVVAGYPVGRLSFLLV